MPRVDRYLLGVLLVPPLMAFIWYLLASVWTAFVYGGRIPPGNVHLRRRIFRYIMAGMYVLAIVEGFIIHVF